MIAQLADQAAAEEKKFVKVRCAHCGLTYPEFHARGRFGCAHCFDAFSPYIEPLMKHIHGHALHAGKRYLAPLGAQDVPAGGGPIKAREISLLESELREAVRREEFEKAARIRDKLRQLKEKR